MTVREQQVVSVGELAAQLVASEEYVIGALDRLGVRPVSDWRGLPAVPAESARRLVEEHRQAYEALADRQRRYGVYTEERRRERQQLSDEIRRKVLRGGDVAQSPRQAAKVMEAQREVLLKFDAKTLTLDEFE